VAPVLTFDIDRSSPTPLYFQLAQAIEGAISGGTLPSGSKLENEVLLAQRYGLSRPTVRRAVQELVDKGLLVRKRGVGTQVIQPHVRRSVELTSLYDDLARAGEAPTTEVLSLERVPASAEIAEELDLGEGAEVVVLRRLRRSHGEPLALMTNHLPGRFHPTVEELAERGLYQFLRSQGVHLRVAHQRIGARLARAEEARLLDEPPTRRPSHHAARRLRRPRHAGGVGASPVPGLALRLRGDPRRSLTRGSGSHTNGFSPASICSPNSVSAAMSGSPPTARTASASATVTSAAGRPA
jgi:DNA-binding GntR family transcriptional regulator